jgi:hypothetical protein
MISRRQLIGGWGAVAVASGLGLGARHKLSGIDRTFGLAVPGGDISAVKEGSRVGATLGRDVGLLTTYYAWEWRQAFPSKMAKAARAAGMTPQITWEPWDPRLKVDQPRYRLANLSAFDEYVDGFAKGAAASGGEVNMRFAHEMNGLWYPWASRVNGNSERTYVSAYRRLHHRFARQHASNVTWTWCPNVMFDGKSDTIKASYPGHDVVDVIGLDGYKNKGHQTPEQLFGPTLELLSHIAPGKPIWINETGCAPGPAKDEWIGSLIDYLKTTSVHTLVWFELALDGQPDWRLLATPDTTRAAKHALARW